MADLDSDGIDDAMEQQARVLAMAAAQAADQLLRGVTAARERARQRDDQVQRDMAQQLQAQHTARVAGFDVVQQDGWWREATPEQIGTVYGSARAWESQMPEAGRARARIEDEMQVRHGVDYSAEVDAALARQHAGIDEIEAVQHVAAATAADRAADNAAHRGDVETAASREDEQQREQGAAQGEWDSAARRKQLAETLSTASGVSDAARDARLTADLGQGRPSVDAVTAAPSSARSRGARRSASQRERGEPSR